MESFEVTVNNLFAVLNGVLKAGGKGKKRC
jgi:hypothetical protein